MFLAVLVSGIAGGYLYNLNVSIPFYFSSFLSILAGASIWLIKTPVINQDKDKILNNFSEINCIVHYRKWIRFYAISRAFVLAPFVGFYPYFLNNQMHLNLKWFGLILGAFTLCGYFSGKTSTRLIKEKSNSLIVILIVMLIMLSFSMLFIASMVNDFGMALSITTVSISLLGLSSGLIRPFVMSMLNNNTINSITRTALISQMEKTYGIYNIAVLIIGGIIIQMYDFAILCAVLGVTFMILISIASEIKLTRKEVL
ncbi:hypothetical protein WAC87_001209 [Shigella flexneri]